MFEKGRLRELITLLSNDCLVIVRKTHVKREEVTRPIKGTIKISKANLKGKTDQMPGSLRE